MRPAVLVDVNGVLSPDTPSEGFVRHNLRLGSVEYKVWLNEQHGEWLRALVEETGAELMWGTTWNATANERIGPRIGLPELPVVEIHDRLLPDEAVDRMDGALFGVSASIRKAGCVAIWAQEFGRPFVWFDDRSGVVSDLERYPITQEHLVVLVDPTYGLRQEHIEQARKWLLDRGAGAAV